MSLNDSPNTFTFTNRIGLLFIARPSAEPTGTTIKHLTKELVVPDTFEEFKARAATWMDGTSIQLCFKHWPAEWREFLLTGIAPAEWEAMFAEDSTNG